MPPQAPIGRRTSQQPAAANAVASGEHDAVDSQQPGDRWQVDERAASTALETRDGRVDV
jgi:hypothetical protein